MKLIRNIILSIFTIMLFQSCSENEIRFEEGTYCGDMNKGIPDGYGTWHGDKESYAGFWKDGKREGNGIWTSGHYKYRGHFKNGKFDGIGVLACKDSILYEGNWKEGKRSGEGIIRDSLNRMIIAEWAADSMLNGARYEDKGVFRGTFDKMLRPEGVGRYDYGNMCFYEGTWTEGKPDGFGIQLSPDGWLHVGTWKHGKFKGEILNYTPDRIYGIDIARYQHNAPINWGALRIKHLGKISKKKITGIVNYPVSFIFIKCTEGETYQNSYYSQDYNNARSHGLRCGSYHFFSIHSEPDKQAENFLSHLKINAGDIAPVLDVEPTESQIKSIGGSHELFRRIRIWLHMVEKSTGMRPILYINQMFVNNHMPYAPDLKKNYEVWIARYGEFKPDIHLSFWQIAPDGRVNGIMGDVDINVFNGYRKTYDRYLRKKTYKGK